MLVKTLAAFVRGIKAIPIIVETDVSCGLPSFQIVGQPDTSMKEAKERLRLAMRNSCFDYPKGRVTVNMSPAEVRKNGSHFDLAMAVGILVATGQLNSDGMERRCFLGELSLDGSVNSVKGILPMVIAMKESGVEEVFVPKVNVKEALLVPDIGIFGVSSLEEVVSHFNGEKILTAEGREQRPLEEELQKSRQKDFVQVRGQEGAKRALMIAVAGGHGLLMVGSPSTGKTMLAERIPGIMPKMSNEEILETTTIYSVAGLLDEKLPYMYHRPFRHPYQKLTLAGLIGGGTVPKPGEITLASKGVLFLDEVGEFDYRLLDALRVPLETKEITLIRNQVQYTYPADFLLVGASNPCPCGYLGDPIHPCKCSASEILRYQRRFSGPIMDRIDMRIYLSPVSYDELSATESLSSQEMKEKIESARHMQTQRYAGTGISLNHQLDEDLVEKFVLLEREGQELLEAAYNKMKLNPRTLLKVKKLARTIADLESCEKVQLHHLAESLQYRERSHEGEN